VNRVALSGSLDLQNPKDLSTGNQLARRARQVATLAANTPVGSWQMGAELQLVGQRYNDAANLQPLHGYGLLNLHASTRLGRSWTLIGRIDNLGDVDYETARGYATGGRVAYVGLKWAPN
jgi:vitamin B12 transporter